MVSVGAAWAVWSMMRCNAGRMAGSTAVGWLLAGSQLLWAVPDGGNDDAAAWGVRWCARPLAWFGPASVWSRR